MFYKQSYILDNDQFQLNQFDFLKSHISRCQEKEIVIDGKYKGVIYVL